jgi:hypothetical protein
MSETRGAHTVLVRKRPEGMELLQRYEHMRGKYYK